MHFSNIHDNNSGIYCLAIGVNIITDFVLLQFVNKDKIIPNEQHDIKNSLSIKATTNKFYTWWGLIYFVHRVICLSPSNI